MLLMSSRSTYGNTGEVQGFHVPEDDVTEVLVPVLEIEQRLWFEVVDTAVECEGNRPDRIVGHRGRDLVSRNEDVLAQSHVHLIPVLPNRLLTA